MKTANARLHPIVWMLTAYTVMFTTLPHCCLEISDLYKGLVYKLFQLVF